MQSHTLSARYTLMSKSCLSAPSTFTTGVWEHSETVTVLLCASVLGRQCTIIQSRRLPRFTKKKHSLILKSKHCMVLQTKIPFATKKHCTVLKKQTPCMVLHNGRHPPLARKKTVQSFGRKINLAWFFKTEECNLLPEKTNIEWFDKKRNVAWFYKKLKVVWFYETGECNLVHTNRSQSFQK